MALSSPCVDQPASAAEAWSLKLCDFKLAHIFCLVYDKEITSFTLYWLICVAVRSFLGGFFFSQFC